MTKSKRVEFADKMYGFISNIGKKTQEKYIFEHYYTIDQIKGTFDCEMIYQNKSYKD